MATGTPKPKTPISTSAMGALIFGFLFAPLSIYFGIRTFAETKVGDPSRTWAIAGVVLAALQVFTVLAFIVASLVQMKYSGYYYAPGQMPYHGVTPNEMYRGRMS